MCRVVFQDAVFDDIYLYEPNTTPETATIQDWLEYTGAYLTNECDQLFEHS